MNTEKNPKKLHWFRKWIVIHHYITNDTSSCILDKYVFQIGISVLQVFYCIVHVHMCFETYIWIGEQEEQLKMPHMEYVHKIFRNMLQCNYM